MANSKRFTILALDDEQAMLDTYQSILRNRYRLLTTQSADDATKALKNNSIDLVLLDLNMPGVHGIQVLEEIKKIDPDQDVIVVTASHDLGSAIQSMKKGAYDFVPKPFEVEEFLGTIRNCLERRSLKQENAYLRRTVEGQFEDIVGKSTVMHKIFEVVQTIAENDSTILILGESGTGKELIARAIHKKSNRKGKPFIAVNCAAIPENLFESEFFGYERGAFTGAMEKREGKFELADGGTIFLDEIGCLPLGMQGKLLRVIQEGVIDRVGGKSPIEVNVRILAATNTDLRKEAKSGRFREDLFYRLNVIPIELPPLRDRGEDITLLADHFLKKYANAFHKTITGFSPEVLSAFRQYPWPGNVRELQNVVERMTVLGKSETIHTTHLPAEFYEIPNLEELDESLNGSRDLRAALSAYEVRLIKKVLYECGDNQTKAAKVLGIHRTTLISKIAGGQRE